MINETILDKNLNEIVPYREFFAALGYKDKDTLFLRRFDDRKRADHLPKNMSIQLYRFDSILSTLHKYNDDHFGIFYVANGGGNGDSEVIKAGGPARAQFVDFDDDSFEDQIRKLNEFPLEPSILIRTRKSLHAYWLLIDGEMKYFREIQQRLAKYFSSDTTMQNESRVMRLYGFNHCKLAPIRELGGFVPDSEEDPVEIKLIKFDPELRYTQRQLHEVLPRLEAQDRKAGGSRKIEKDGELVLIGHRHDYIVSRIGTILNKIGDIASDEMIYSMIESDFLQHCEDAESEDLTKFRPKYMRTIAKFRAQREAETKDPGFYKYAVRAWEYYNGRRFNTDAASWEEVAEAGRRAKEEKISFDQDFGDITRAVEKAMDGGQSESGEKPGSSATLINLPALTRSITDGYRVYYVMNPDDVEVLRGFHYTATTSPSGWNRAFAPIFTGAMVGIISGNSPEAREAAEQIARDLKKYAFETLIISDLPGGGMKAFIEAGNTLDDFRTFLQGKTWILAPWAYINKQDNVCVRPSSLADNFSKVCNFAIIRNPLDDNDMFFAYQDGVYKRWNKAQIKSSLRKFVPIVHQKDAQIGEAQRTIFELGAKIHSFEELDADERFINFKNGLLDLETRHLVPHTPKVLCTMQLSFNYDPDAREMPVFTGFMNDMFRQKDGSVDRESMVILQQYAGLLISNIPVYRCKKSLFLCSIRGNTGKSCFLNLLEKILGESNITSIPLQNMNEATGRFLLGTAMGTRAIINGDQQTDDVTESSVFKSLTGGDIVKMENKGQTPLMIRYRGGIAIACNGLPSFSDDRGEHIFERILLIMCRNVIPPEKRDPQMLDKMIPEIPAIINWFLAGLYKLKENNFKFPRSEATDAALHEYRKQLDSVYKFINEYELGEQSDPFRFVLTKNRKDKMLKSELYDLYESFCQRQDVDIVPVKRKNFGQRLERMGLEVNPRGNYGTKRGVYVVYGIALVNSSNCDRTHSDPEFVLKLFREAMERERLLDLPENDAFDD